MGTVQAANAALTAQDIRDSAKSLNYAYALPPLGTPFSEAVAYMNYKGYKFGSAATAGTNEIAVTNNTALSANFNPYTGHFDGTTYFGTGTADINQELERFTPFGSGNHVFGTDKLTLQPVISAGTYETHAIHKPANSGVVLNHRTTANKTETPFANLVAVSGTTPANLEVGTVGATAVGWVFIRAKSGTGITVEQLFTYEGNNVTLTENRPVYWTRFAAARYTAGNYGHLAAAAGTPFTLSNTVPSWVGAGWAIYNSPQDGWGHQRYTMQKVATIAGDRLSFTADVATGPFNSSSYGAVVFGPALTSGSIWSKDLVADPTSQSVSAAEITFSYTSAIAQYCAGEFRETNGDVPYTAEGCNTLLNTTYAAEPFGMFDGLLWTWKYAKSWYSLDSHPWTEFDFEVWSSIYQGSKELTLNIHTEKDANDRILNPAGRAKVYTSTGTLPVGTKWGTTASGIDYFYLASSNKWVRAQGIPDKGMFSTKDSSNLRVALIDGAQHKVARIWYGTSIVDEFIEGLHVSRTTYNNPGVSLPSQIGVDRAVIGFQPWHADGHMFPRSNSQATIGLNIHSLKFYSA